jgi:hypothetical protein
MECRLSITHRLRPPLRHVLQRQGSQIHQRCIIGHASRVCHRLCHVELNALRDRAPWKSVHFDLHIVIVRAAYAKNGASRSLPMNNILTETLRAIRINRLSEEVAFYSKKDTLYRAFRISSGRAGPEGGDHSFHAR